MYVPRAMYSLRMSFWTVPESLSAGISCFSATAMYRHSRIDAVALMVMDVETRSSGIPAKRSSMSCTLEMDTPTLPTSLLAIGWSAS